MKKPIILVTNDDGITSKGIKHLVTIVQELGEVYVIAPNSPQSGKGHAITLAEPLKLHTNDIFGAKIQSYECSGTPADCVKVAKHYVLKDKKPDLVVSGINHGANTAISVVYSGTMSAAIEAAIEDLPAVGFSLADYDDAPDFSHCTEFILKICTQVLENKLPKGVALNVNFPKKSKEALKGIKVVKQAHAIYKETLNPRKDPMGRTYFWMEGYFHNFEPKNTETDEWAVANNYVSVVPCQFDLTSYDSISKVKYLES